MGRKFKPKTCREGAVTNLDFQTAGVKNRLSLGKHSEDIATCILGEKNRPVIPKYLQVSNTEFSHGCKGLAFGQVCTGRAPAAC